MRHLKRWRGIAVFTAVVVILLVPLTGQETNLVDLNSGRARSEYSVLGRIVYQGDRNTEFSRRYNVERPEHEQWVRVSSYQLYNATSPHYRYHSAESLMGTLVAAFDAKQIPREEQSALAHELLSLMRQEKLSEAERFVYELGR